jgi:hypothetical protein
VLSCNPLVVSEDRVVGSESAAVMVSQNLKRLDYVASWLLDVNNHIQATWKIKHDHQVQGVM